MGIPIVSQLWGRAVDTAVAVFAPSVKFAGPLTSGPRTVPGRVIGYTSGPVPPTFPPGLGAASPTPPVSEPPPGLVAWDCILECGRTGGCLNSYGYPIREGQSCWHSARLMASKDFAQHSPDLYVRAVLLGIIEEENV